MQQIGLFSGSFNPIHKGHINLARYVLEHTALDEVWLVVSPCNPFKADQALLSEHTRLRMVELALEQEMGMKASDVEFDLPKPSYTIQTLRHLSNLYPDTEFTLIIGGDNWVAFDRWREYEEIWNNYHLIVYPREGQELPTRSNESMKGVRVVNAPLFPISSTEIRTLIAKGESTTDWLDEKVAQLVRQEKLYL